MGEPSAAHGILTRGLKYKKINVVAFIYELYIIQQKSIFLRKILRYFTFDLLL